MPEKLKRVLVLRVYNGCNFDDIGKILLISSRQARNRLEQALAMVKSRMESEE
jgi:DNA-directed RNA polymerase specialized sigma24 family protein